jgi:hypothetical protein
MDDAEDRPRDLGFDALFPREEPVPFRENKKARLTCSLIGLAAMAFALVTGLTAALRQSVAGVILFVGFCLVLTGLFGSGAMPDG